jgi:uncharacterized membrane protein YbhN (UPF0104 family)
MACEQQVDAGAGKHWEEGNDIHNTAEEDRERRCAVLSSNRRVAENVVMARPKSIAKWLGWIATIASLVFVADKLRSLATQDVLGALHSTTVWAWLASLFAAMGLVASVGRGWVALLELLQGRRLPRRRLFLIFVRTQIGKYLPGSVFHYILRHAGAREAGVDHSVLVASSIWEAVSLAGMAVLGTVMFLGQSRTAVVPVSVTAGAVVGIIVGATALVGVLLRKGLSAPMNWSALAAVLASHAVFFVAGAVALWALLAGSIPNAAPRLDIALGAWACAWLLGFLTPGAPGGLGIRESVLILALSPHIAESQAVVTALSLRAVTVAAECLSWAIATPLALMTPRGSTTA